MDQGKNNSNRKGVKRKVTKETVTTTKETMSEEVNSHESSSPSSSGSGAEGGLTKWIPAFGAFVGAGVAIVNVIDAWTVSYAAVFGSLFLVLFIVGYSLEIKLKKLFLALVGLGAIVCFASILFMKYSPVVPFPEPSPVAPDAAKIAFVEKLEGQLNDLAAGQGLYDLEATILKSFKNKGVYVYEYIGTIRTRHTIEDYLGDLNLVHQDYHVEIDVQESMEYLNDDLVFDAIFVRHH